MSLEGVNRLSMNDVKKRLRREALEWADSQKGVTRCICGWRWTGRFGDGRERFKAHRQRCKAAA